MAHRATRHLPMERQLWVVDSFEDIPPPRSFRDLHPRWPEGKQRATAAQFQRRCFRAGVPRATAASSHGANLGVKFQLIHMCSLLNRWAPWLGPLDQGAGHRRFMWPGMVAHLVFTSQIDMLLQRRVLALRQQLPLEL